MFELGRRHAFGFRCSGHHRSCCCGSPALYPTTGDLLAVAGYVVLHVVVFAAYHETYEWEEGPDPLRDVGIALGHNTHVAAAVHLLPVTRNSPVWFVLRFFGRSNGGFGWPASHNYATGWHVFNGLVIMTFVTVHMISFWVDWIGKGVVTVNTTVSLDEDNHAAVTARSTVTVNKWLHEAFLSNECWEECGACLGEVAWLTGVLLIVLSLGCVRRSCYYLFLYTHWVFFLTFFVFGGLHDIQLIHWMIPSFFLYGVDWFLRGYRIREVRIVPYHNARGDVVPGRFTVKVAPDKTGRKRELLPGDVGGLFVYLNVPSVSRREWHPFSLCAAAHSRKGNRADIIVRPHGPESWTARVLRAAGGDRSLKAYSSGTYGASDLGLSSSTVVFVAGGVGITALEPLLKRVVLSTKESAFVGTAGAATVIRQVVLIWAVREEEDLSWFASDLSSYQEASGETVSFEARLFVTHSLSTAHASVHAAASAVGLDVQSVELAEIGQQAALRVPQKEEDGGAERISAMAGRPRVVAKTRTMRGRPDLAAELGRICSECTEAHVDVFVCGPSSMRISVLEAAVSQPRPIMLVHDETFEL